MKSSQTNPLSMRKLVKEQNRIKKLYGFAFPLRRLKTA